MVPFSCIAFSVVYLPSSCYAVPVGRVAMITMSTPLSPKYNKEVIGRVAILCFEPHSETRSASASSHVAVCLAFCVFEFLLCLTMFRFFFPSLFFLAVPPSARWVSILTQARGIFIPLSLGFLSYVSVLFYCSIRS